MIILQALYFMMPGYCANMAPVFAAKIFGEFFSYPLDFGVEINKKPVLGKNKTWRGLIAAILIGIIIVALQLYLYSFLFFKNLSILDYTQINVWLLGLLFGLGVILADAVKSFFKRRKSLKPGDKWFPWDQLDFIGALILISLVFLPPLEIIIIISFISPLLPIAANWLGYKLKLKKVAW